MVSTFIKNGSNIILRKQSSILSAATVIMIAYGLSSLLGLVRNRLLAQLFFVNHKSLLDAYFAAFVLPDTIFQLLILGALSAAFIPVFTEALRRDKKEAWHIANSAASGILFLFLVLSAGLFIFAYPASKILAPSFTPELTQITAELIRVMLAAQFFFALSSFMTGILQSHHLFILSALAPLFYNLGIIIGTIFLSPSIGIFGPAVGVVLGSFLHFLIQLPAVIKVGFRPRLSTDWKNPYVKKMLRLMPARAFTLGLGQLERVIAVAVSSSLAAGTITLFNFARQLYILPIGILGATIGQASFPTLVHAREEGQDKFGETIAATILQLLFFVLPAAALLLVLRIPAVRLAFGSKAFPWEATLLTGKAVAIFSLSVPAQAINQLLTRSFYAAQNTKIPLISAAISTLPVIFLAPFFSIKLGLGILGIVTSIVILDFFNVIILTVVLNMLIVPGLIKRMAKPATKIAIASVATGLCLWVPLRLLDQFVFDTTKTLALIGLSTSVSVIGLVVYLILAKLLKIEQLSAVLEITQKIGNWKQVLSESEEVLESTTREV
ncbi:murein biosynthesis integral membrane protein MurJ [Candidatus Collierbacteria bacterium]|nr:murein biosynthesis integral membrane protein MurJ [Candidatus Collierbacteria bacterium]